MRPLSVPPSPSACLPLPLPLEGDLPPSPSLSLSHIHTMPMPRAATLPTRSSALACCKTWRTCSPALPRTLCVRTPTAPSSQVGTWHRCTVCTAHWCASPCSHAQHVTHPAAARPPPAGTNPPVAECGCWVSGGPSGTLDANTSFSIGTSVTILSQSVKDANKQVRGKLLAH